jgi:hypothetical protein
MPKIHISFANICQLLVYMCNILGGNFHYQKSHNLNFFMDSMQILRHNGNASSDFMKMV